MGEREPIVVHHPELEALLRVDRIDGPTLDAIEKRLRAWGTLEIPRLPSGLFAASDGGGRDARSGYSATWLRDSVHVAHALWRTGEADAARRALEAILRFQLRTRDRFDAILAGRADPSDPLQRPHVRFDGLHLRELPERWAHAQNDALGSVLWLAASMWREGAWRPRGVDLGLLARYPSYFECIRYWEDADSGHWEEGRRVHASSIGVVVAALHALADAIEATGLWALPAPDQAWTAAELRQLAEPGSAHLAGVLPRESPPERAADLATLFLVEPLRWVAGEAASELVDFVRRELEGPYGIRRYRGDSYWCADYRTRVAPEARSADYSENTDERDALLKPGTEAQWCLGDPLLAVHFGRRWRKNGEASDREAFERHLRRALGQITGPGEWCAPGRCPEAWYLESSEEGRYRPNDQTPLAWTVANLRLALAEGRRVVG